MRQSRSQKVVMYLEPVIHTAFKKAYDADPSVDTQSEYLRNLVIQDLKGKGLLTDKMIADAFLS